MRVTVALVVSLFVAVPAFSQHQHNPESAAVDFGIFPTAPLGPLPCLQAGGIGGPGDPCSFKIHKLIPDEALVAKGGEVTFRIMGGGHAFAIYEVSPDTTRDAIGQYLCPGADPSTLSDPAQHACNQSGANANAQHIVKDGRDDVVLVAQANLTNAHPDNRVWSESGRLTSAGGIGFLNTPPTPAGQLITYRFLKTGRYLVICMNRVHFLNDWMFGFVDVHE